MKNRKIWLVFFLLLAFTVRFWLSTRYIPVGSEKGIADQLAYLEYNYRTMGGDYARTVSLILTPIMLIGRLFGMDDLTGTIVGGCFIGALSIIPLWFISEHLKINPMVTSFLYVFAPLDISEVLTWGGYSMLFGMLAVNVYVWLVLSKRHWLSGLVLLPVILTHHSSSMYIGVFMATIMLLSLVKERKLEPLLISGFAVITVVLLLKYGHIVYGLDIERGLETGVGLASLGALRVVDPRVYLFIVGPFALMLALIGLKPFLRQNKSILILTWVFLPHLLTFVPLFSNPDFNIRLLAFGAGSMSVVGCYAFMNWKNRNNILRTILVTLLFLSILLTVVYSIHGFSQYGV